MTDIRDNGVVTVGFIPLLDCALLVAAHEKGLARQHGLKLRLVREVSWANVRDRVSYGHFDAAHMLGPMVVASHLMPWPGDMPFVAPVALGTGGNAITVSQMLWKSMQEHGAAAGAEPARQAAALHEVIARRQASGADPLTFAMVFPFSCHNYQLRDWLACGGVDADRDIRLIVLPPPMLVEAIRTGQVDGFCVGEPWNSLAVDAGLGTIVAVSTDIWKHAPEKVLGMRADYIEEKPAQVNALIRSLVDAAHWASAPENRQELAAMLSAPRYVGAPERLLRSALEGEILTAPGATALQRPNFIQLGAEATVPRNADAQMLCARIEQCGHAQPTETARKNAIASFRTDLYANALRTGSVDSAHAC